MLQDLLMSSWSLASDLQYKSYSGGDFIVLSQGIQLTEIFDALSSARAGSHLLAASFGSINHFSSQQPKHCLIIWISKQVEIYPWALVWIWSCLWAAIMCNYIIYGTPLNHLSCNNCSAVGRSLGSNFITFNRNSLSSSIRQSSWIISNGLCFWFSLM